LTRAVPLCCAWFVAGLVLAPAAPAANWGLEAPEVVLGGVPFTVEVSGPPDGFPVVLLAGARADTLRGPGPVGGLRLARG
jgi:hypothetical protein